MGGKESALTAAGYGRTYGWAEMTVGKCHPSTFTAPLCRKLRNMWAIKEKSEMRDAPELDNAMNDKAGN